MHSADPSLRVALTTKEVSLTANPTYSRQLEGFLWSAGSVLLKWTGFEGPAWLPLPSSSWGSFEHRTKEIFLPSAERPEGLAIRMGIFEPQSPCLQRLLAPGEESTVSDVKGALGLPLTQNQNKQTNKTNDSTEVGLSKGVAATLYPGHHFILHLHKSPPAMQLLQSK